MNPLFLASWTQLSKPFRKHSLQKLDELRPAAGQVQLQHDVVELIYHWHNLAVCEMVSWRDFPPDPVWNSKRLGGAISVEVAEETLALLVRVGLLVPVDGGYKKAAAGLTFDEGVPNLAILELHKQMFGKAQQTMDNHPFEQRHFMSETMAVEMSNIALARDLMSEFIERFNKLVCSQEGGEVYHVAVQFFKVTE